MSSDNWERLVRVVFRREQDRELALADSRSTSFSSISISLDLEEPSLTLQREEQNVANGERNPRFDSSDRFYVAPPINVGEYSGLAIGRGSNLSQMDVQNSDHGHVIEVSTNERTTEGGFAGSKGCGGAPCGFADAKTSSKDAQERSASMRKLFIAVTLCIVFMSVEVVGGIEANSLAILTDAAHLLSDVAAFAISLLSLWAAGWEANPRQSYGFFRIEILGALVSIQLIWLLAGILVYEAIVRLINDTGEVKGFLMFLVSAFGLVVNVIMALLLGRDGHKAPDEGPTTPLLSSATEGESKPKQKKQWNINFQGAYLHVLGDSIQSIGVMIGGAIIWYKPEWKILDLICTLIFSVFVLGTTINMLRNILEVLMESTPREIDVTRLEKGLCEMEEVIAVHELHIWAITVGKVLLACHVKIRPEADADMMLDKVINYIQTESNISHVTIQIEREQN